MSIYIGSTELSEGDLKIGNTNVEVYHGSTKIFPPAASEVTVSGTITDSIVGATITAPLTYSVTGNAGSTISFQKGVTANSGYSHPANYSENSSIFTVSRSGNTLTFSGTAPSSSNTNHNFTVSGSAVETTYSVSGTATTSLTNCSINSTEINGTRTVTSGDSYDFILTPDSNYEFTNANNVTITNLALSQTTTLLSNGTIRVRVSWDAGVGNIDDDFNISATASASDVSLTLSPTNNVGSATAVLSKSVITGTPGSTEDITLTVTTNANDRYFTTYPSIDGNDNFTIQSTVDSLPIFSGDSNNYHRRRTFTLRVTIPSSATTDAFSIEGATATVKSVMWDNTSQSIGSGAGNFSFGFKSTDTDGEPPTVSETASWISNFAVASYSGGVGTATGTVTQNASFDTDRVATLVLTSTADSSTDDLTLTQAHQEAADPASTGSLPADDTFSYDPSLSDTYDIAVTTNGAWQSNVTQLPSGWTATDIGTQTNNGTIRITKPSGSSFITGTIRVGLFPSDSLAIDDRLDDFRLDYEPSA